MLGNRTHARVSKFNVGTTKLSPISSESGGGGGLVKATLAHRLRVSWCLCTIYNTLLTTNENAKLTRNII